LALRACSLSDDKGGSEKEQQNQLRFERSVERLGVWDQVLTGMLS
jgi:hypothetical protein